MDKRYLEGQTALVTGGALRIGRAICLALAAAGANVVVHYRSSRDAAESLRYELEALGVAAFIVPADFDETDSCATLIDEAWSATGTIDILVNSAAVFHKDSLRTFTPEKLRSELRINLEAPLLLMQAFASKARRGHIVNLLDTRVDGDDTTCLPYLLSKKALQDSTRLAALELAPEFTVNAVAPGDVLPPNQTTSDYVTEYALSAPLEPRPSPDNIAAAVLFLVSMDTITGQTIFVDSGAHLI